MKKVVHEDIGMNLNVRKLCTFGRDLQELHPGKVIAEDFFSFISPARQVIPPIRIPQADRSGNPFLKL